MTENTCAATTLPETLRTVLANHDATREAYLASRDRLPPMMESIKRHRTTAHAARQKADAAAEAWRNALRNSDGTLTKEVRALKRKEVENRELAEELETLATELEQDLQRRHAENAVARSRYEEAQRSACELYLEHRLAEAARGLFTSEAAEPFLSLLAARLDRIPQETATDPLVKKMLNPIVFDSDRKAVETINAKRRAMLVATLVSDYLPQVPTGEAANDPTLQTLTLLPRTEFEHGEIYTSPLKRNILLKRLKKEDRAQEVADEEA